MIPQEVHNIAKVLEQGGAVDTLLIGGYVRDTILGLEPKDIDLEVFGMSMEKIHALIAPLYKTCQVGEAFSVLKVYAGDYDIDIAIPRREEKVGIGHKGFKVVPDPWMSVTEAAKRRDFTINAISMKLDGTIVDPLNGKVDLERGFLKACNADAFNEDPLRVMRALQFIARFNLVMDHATIGLCSAISDRMVELPKERLWEEWKKWALKGKNLGWALKELRMTRCLDPEISAMYGVQQDPEWHPEGCVFIHTCHVVDAAVEVANRDNLGEHDRLVLIFSALCHDFGKVSTTQLVEGRWRALGHCEESVPHSRAFLEGIGAPILLVDQVCKLVAEHLAHTGIKEPTARVVNRLARRLFPATLAQLSCLIEADHSGRPPLPKGNPFSSWLDLAGTLNIRNNAPVPILLGRHLIPMGVKPGVGMGELLNKAYEAQLDNQFSDLEGAVAFIQSLLLDS